MTLGALAVIGLFVVLIALAGDQLARLPITAPMLAVGVGLAISLIGSRHVSITLGSEEVLVIAEVTLVVLLFSDASLAALAATVGFTIAVGGNGFIGAFVAGIALRLATGELCDSWLSLSENVGQLGAIVAFVMFGATMVEPALDVLTWRIVLSAMVLLTLARMIPVAIALVGSGVRLPTVAFIGWFGPRGLASMLFALALSHEDLMVENTPLIATITITVLASIVLHGITAAPLARLYGNWLDSHPKGDDLCEQFDVAPQRSRPNIAIES